MGWPLASIVEDNTMPTSNEDQETFDWIEESAQLELPFDEEDD